MSQPIFLTLVSVLFLLSFTPFAAISVIGFAWIGMLYLAYGRRVTAHKTADSYLPFV